MKDLIDFLTALASGEFDPQNLYQRGFPYLYDIDYSKEGKRVVLEVEGTRYFPDGYSTILRVGVSPEFYGTGQTHISIDKTDTILERIFLREKIDLQALEKEFENAILFAEQNCLPLLKKLIEREIAVTYGVNDSGSFLVAVNPREDDTPIGFAALEYLKLDKKPEDLPVYSYANPNS